MTSNVTAKAYLVNCHCTDVIVRIRDEALLQFL